MFETYAHFVNAEIHFINVRNDKSVSLEIENRRRVNRIVKYEDEKCYSMKEENHSLVTISLFEKHSMLFKLDLMSVEICSSREIISKDMKIRLKNNIIIYELFDVVTRFVDVITRHLRI